MCLLESLKYIFVLWQLLGFSQGIVLFSLNVLSTEFDNFSWIFNQIIWLKRALQRVHNSRKFYFAKIFSIKIWEICCHGNSLKFPGFFLKNIRYVYCCPNRINLFKIESFFELLLKFSHFLINYSFFLVEL